MRVLRFVLPALFGCCLLFAAGAALAGTAATATPISMRSTQAPTNVLPPDPFLDGAVTTTAGATCTRCDPMHVDTCVGQPNHGPCLTGLPNCHCRKCNQVFDCWND